VITGSIFSKGTWNDPVIEASRAMLMRTSCYSEHEGENYQAYQDQDLDAAEPELQFAEEADAKVVDGDYCGEEDDDEKSIVAIRNFVKPESDNEDAGYEVVGGCDDVLTES
jgi:hypothetical protein